MGIRGQRIKEEGNKTSSPISRLIFRFQKIGSRSTWRSSFTVLGHTPKRCPTMPQGHVLHYVHRGLVCDSQKLEKKKNPDVPQQKNGYRICGSFTQWNTTQLLRTKISWALQAMNGTRKFPEWGNSDSKGHVWYVLTNTWILPKTDIQNTQDIVHRTQKAQ